MNRQKASYAERVAERLRALQVDYRRIVEDSTVRNIDPNRRSSDMVFVGFPDWGWGPSDTEHEARRMRMLGELAKTEPLVRMLFPHPVGNTAKTLDKGLALLCNWMTRGGKGAHSVPASVEAATGIVNTTFDELCGLVTSLPADPDPVRLIVDTNALIDNPDLACYTSELGTRYRAHIPTVVLGELDDLKRSGRTPELRDAAGKAGRRLKALRDNGDPLVGTRVAGQVFAVFEHVEPRSDLLPSWLDMEVPDDRFVASALLLQSDHPGATVYVATSDLNLQNKLAAVGLPFIEPPDS